MNKYRVEVYGYCEEYFEAETKAKAMYKAFKLFVECGPKWDFHKFLIETTVSKVSR